MLDSHPRLVKKIRPVSVPSLAPARIPFSETADYDRYRRRRLDALQRHLNRHPDRLARQIEMLPYFRDMLLSGRVRLRPVRRAQREWIYRQTDLDLAARALFRIAWTQHCESVDWPTPNR